MEIVFGRVSIGTIIEENIKDRIPKEIAAITTASWVLNIDPIKIPIKLNKEIAIKIKIVKAKRLWIKEIFKKKLATIKIVSTWIPIRTKQVIKSLKISLLPFTLLEMFLMYALEVLSLILNTEAKTVDPNKIKNMIKLGNK